MANQKINITNYIKSQLEDKSANYSERKNKKIECLEEIGAAISSAESREWTKYSNYKYLVSKMSDSALTELKDAINRVQFQRKSFTK